MKKRILVMVITIAAIICTMAFPVSAKDVTVKLNGNTVYFDVAPQIINDRTMVPMRAIFEALGYSVSWDGHSKKITASGSDGTVTMNVGSQTFYRNNSSYTSDVAPTIINSRTLVPLRALGEALNYDVYWDSPTYTAWLEKYNGVITMSEAVNLVKSGEQRFGDETYILVSSGYNNTAHDNCFTVRVEFPGDFPDETYQSVRWVSKTTGKILGGVE